MGYSAAIMTVGSMVTSHNASKSAQRMNNMFNSMNQKIAEEQARDALERGRVAESQKRSETAQVIGSQRAAMAAMGIDISEGTALDVQTDTARSGEIDALAIRNNAAREAWGYQVQGTDMRFRGIINDAAARSQRDQTIMQGGSRLAQINYDRGKSKNTTNGSQTLGGEVYGTSEGE